MNPAPAKSDDESDSVDDVIDRHVQAYNQANAFIGDGEAEELDEKDEQDEEEDSEEEKMVRFSAARARTIRSALPRVIEFTLHSPPFRTGYHWSIGFWPYDGRPEILLPVGIEPRT